MDHIRVITQNGPDSVLDKTKSMTQITVTAKTQREFLTTSSSLPENYGDNSLIIHNQYSFPEFHTSFSFCSSFIHNSSSFCHLSSIRSLIFLHLSTIHSHILHLFTIHCLIRLSTIHSLFVVHLSIISAPSHNSTLTSLSVFLNSTLPSFIYPYSFYSYHNSFSSSHSSTIHSFLVLHISAFHSPSLHTPSLSSFIIYVLNPKSTSLLSLKPSPTPPMQTPTRAPPSPLSLGISAAVACSVWRRSAPVQISSPTWQISP